MNQVAITDTLNMSELAANATQYIKMLRILTREGKSMEHIQRSLCWSRLRSLHQYQPDQHLHVDQLYANLKLEVRA